MIKTILSLLTGAVLLISCAAIPVERYDDRMEESGIYQKSDDKSVIHISGNFFGDTQMPFLFATQDKSIRHYTIVINSDGGDGYATTSMVNRILKMKAEGIKFTTIADNRAFSAGFFIWMMGDERLMTEGSSLMIHTIVAQAASGGETPLSSHIKMITALDENIIQQTYRALPMVDRLWLDTALRYSGMTWVLPDEALELGLATGMVK